MDNRNIVTVTKDVSILATTDEERSYRLAAAECDLTLSEYGRMGMDRLRRASHSWPWTEVPVEGSQMGREGRDRNVFRRRYLLLCHQREQDGLPPVTQGEAALLAQKGRPFMVRVRVPPQK